MKRLVFAGIAILLIAAAGVAAWFFFLKAKPQAHDAAAEAVAVKPEFLEVDSLSVPVIRDGRVEKYVLLRLTLEFSDAAARDLARNAMPLLKDAYLRDLHGYFGNQMSTDENIDLRVVKGRLMRVSEKIFGAGKVLDVLIQGAFEREWKPQ